MILAAKAVALRAVTVDNKKKNYNHINVLCKFIIFTLGHIFTAVLGLKNDNLHGIYNHRIHLCLGLCVGSQLSVLFFGQVA